MKLKGREELFCRNYVSNGRNRARAAKEAGYSSANASAQAKRLLERAEIKQYIDSLTNEQEALARINATGVLTEIAKIAFFDLSEILNTLRGDSVLDKENWTEEARSAISSIKITRTTSPDKSVHYTTEFRTWDRLKALKMLGDHVGAFTDLNVAIAVLKTYGIELSKCDGRWQVVE